MIITHGGQYLRQSMKHIFKKLNYFHKSVLITVKITQTFYIIFHLESRKIFKNVFRKTFVCASGHNLALKNILKGVTKHNN